MSETMRWDISTAYTAHTAYTPVLYQYHRMYRIHICMHISFYILICKYYPKYKRELIDFCVYLFDGDHSIDRSLDH